MVDTSEASVHEIRFDSESDEKYVGQIDDNEQPHGFGTYFDDEGQKQYEGMWCHGDKHGPGCEFDEGFK